MNVKMVVTDLDGTLLRDDKTISERTLSALKRCRDKGLKVVYATGRGVSAGDVAPAELFDGFAQCNGATAQIGDTLIYSKRIEIDKARPLLLAADVRGIEIVAECDDFHFANFNLAERWERFKDYAKFTDFKTLSGKADKLYTSSATQEIIDFLHTHISADMYITISNDGFAFVMHKGATKSKAVNALATEWRINPSEIVSFGDDTNDIDLLDFCGISVAMENALENVKKSANVICDTNENDGVAKWLEENIL